MGGVAHNRRGRMGRMTGTHREREDKFDVESRFALPELSALLSEGGHIVRQWVDLHSTYCDTDDQRLLVGQMTLRRREGDTDDGWQLTLPGGRARTEVRFDLDADDGIPEGLRTLLARLVAVDELCPVVVVDIERRLQLFRDAEDTTVLEVADDLVHASVPGEPGVVSPWREMDVEFGAGSEKLLRTVGKRLVAAGTRPSTRASKLARALPGRHPGETAR